MFIGLGSVIKPFTKSAVFILGEVLTPIYQLRNECLSLGQPRQNSLPNAYEPAGNGFNTHRAYADKITFVFDPFSAFATPLELPQLKVKMLSLPQLKRGFVQALSNPHGQIAVLVLPLIVVLMTAAVGMGYSAYAIIQKNKRNTYCHHILLKLNSLYKVQLENLYRLNKKIKSANKQYRLAQKILAAALASGHPGPIGAAKLYLNSVKAYLGQLKIEQLLILKNANRHWQQAQSQLQTPHTIWVKNIKPLMVRSNSSQVVSPYTTIEPFSVVQKSQVQWRHQLEFLTYKFNLSGSCQSTLQRRQHTWAPTITMDKL